MIAHQLPIFVVEDALAHVRDLALTATPFETGGIIVGVTTVEGLWITSFVEIEVSKRHLTRFVIPAGATHPIVDELRLIDPRLGYLGDWHSHPANHGPSGIDFATLTDLVLGSLGRRRLLGLVRRMGEDWDLGLWTVTRLHRPERADVELTGPVPPA